MVRIEEVEISRIEVPAERARATFTPEQEAELEASIRTHGFTVPILVSPLPGGKFRLIDGEHRIAVAKKIGMIKVPAVVAEADEKRLTMLNILANTARGTQNPMDVAIMLKKAREAGATEEELAAATGHTAEWVRFYLLLTELPEQYQNLLREGRLKVGHIREAARLPTPQETAAALESTLVHNWTVEELKYYVDRRIPEVQKILSSTPPSELPPPPTPQVAEEIVSYGNCMTCGRKVPRKDLTMPTICPDCRSFLEYFADQFGDMKTAMETLYKAYNFYVDMVQKAQSREAGFSESVSPSTPPGAKGPEKPASPRVSEGEVDEETLKLARKLKILKEAGLL